MYSPLVLIWLGLTLLVFVSPIQLDSTQICWWVCTLKSKEFYSQQGQGFFVYPAISRLAWKLTWPSTILVFPEIAFVLGKVAGVWTRNPYALHVMPLNWVPGFLLLHLCMFLAWCTATGAVLPFVITVFMMSTVWWNILLFLDWKQSKISRSMEKSSQILATSKCLMSLITK